MLALRSISIASLCLVAACSGGVDSSQRALNGTVDTAQMKLVNAQAVATARDGRVFVAPISATGAFRMVLPTGTQYTLRFANATSAANLYDSFAVLAVRPGRYVFSWTPGAEVSLGRVGIGTVASGLKPASEESESGSSSGSASSGSGEKEDGGSCKEDDEAKACDLAQGKDEVEVESDDDMLAEVDTDHDGVSDAEDSKDDRPECTAMSMTQKDDDCQGNEDDEKEMDDEHSTSCSTMTGGSTTGGGAASGTVPVNGVL
jgi:hypothetical protein